MCWREIKFHLNQTGNKSSMLLPEHNVSVRWRIIHWTSSISRYLLISIPVLMPSMVDAPAWLDSVPDSAVRCPVTWNLKLPNYSWSSIEYISICVAVECSDAAPMPCYVWNYALNYWKDMIHNDTSLRRRPITIVERLTCTTDSMLRKVLPLCGLKLIVSFCFLGLFINLTTPFPPRYQFFFQTLDDVNGTKTVNPQLHSFPYKE